MIGLIRVLTLTDAQALNYHGRLINDHYDLPILSACIKDQEQGIHDLASEKKAIPKILALGQELVRSGCRLLIVSCAADPAVTELRSSTTVPVIGAGSSAALLAGASGKRTGVIGITEEIPAVIQQILSSSFSGYLKPEGIHNTNDLLTESGQAACLWAVKQLISKGAGQILFACTGMGTIHLKEQLLSHQITIPLIDAVEAEGMFANFYYQQLIN